MGEKAARECFRARETQPVMQDREKAGQRAELRLLRKMLPRIGKLFDRKGISVETMCVS